MKTEISNQVWEYVYKNNLRLSVNMQTSQFEIHTTTNKLVAKGNAFSDLLQIIKRRNKNGIQKKKH